MNRRTLLGAAGGVGLALLPRMASATTGGDALQAQIDAAYAAGGGTVDLPAGVILVGSLVMKSKVRLRGQGMGITTLRLVDGAGPDIRSSRVIQSRWAAQSGVAGAPAGTDWDEDIVIENLTIDGNRANQTSPAPTLAAMNADNTAAIVLDHVHRPSLENVEIVNAKYRGLLVLNSTSGSDDMPVLRNVRVVYSGYSGIVLLWVWSAIVQGCRTDTCARAGIYLEGCRYSSVVGCLARNSLAVDGDGYGFVFDYAGGDGFVTATGNVASVCRSDGFLVSSDNTTSSYILLDGNIATGNSGAGFHLWHAPSAVMGTNISKWNVTDTTLITT